MEFERKPLSLLELCVRTVIDNLRYVGSMDGVEMQLLERILPHCTLDQLTHIESCTEMDISPVTDKLWKRFYQCQFGEDNTNLVVKKMKQNRVHYKWKDLFTVKIVKKMKPNRVHYKWKDLFKAKTEKQKEVEDMMVERLTKKYQAEKAEMDNVENLGGSSLLVWTNSMSTMMLRHLADLVASGTRTSSGFKKVHLNNCAKALNDHFKLAITGDQVSNHLKKWRKVWAKIEKLKKMSGALWDEDTCTIRLEHEHYAGHIKDHKGDANYLNTPIEHYHEMATIFGASMATGKYAKSGNDPMSIEVHDIEEDEGANGSSDVNMSATANVGESSSAAKRPTKRAKVVSNEDDPLMSTLKFGLERVAVALEKAAGANDDIPEGLWDELAALPGFDEGHLAHYYAHLVDNPKTAKAFVNLSVSNKLVWVTRYVSENFSA